MSTAWSATNKNSDFVVSGGGLIISTSVFTGAYSNGQATASATTGQKKFCEVTINAVSSQVAVGLSNSSITFGYGRWLGENANSIGYYYDSNIYAGGGSLGTGATYTAGDVIGVAIDINAGTVEFFKNGASQGVFTHGITGDLFPAYLLQYDGTTTCQLTANFGATSFAHSPPSGFTGFDTSSGISLSLAATEATDIASFSVSLKDSLSLAATEAKDTAAFSASLKDLLSLAATEAKDTAAFSASLSNAASLAATEATDTASFTLTTGAVLSLAATEAADTASISASLSDIASLAATEAQDTAAFSLSGSAPVAEHFWPFTTPKKRKKDPLELLIAEIEAATQQVPAAPSKELVRAIERREAVKDLQREYTAREVRERIFRILREQQAEQDDEEAFLLLAA